MSPGGSKSYKSWSLYPMGSRLNTMDTVDGITVEISGVAAEAVELPRT